MKFRITVIIFLLLVCGSTLILTNSLMQSLIGFSSIGWFASYLIPRVIFTVSLVILSVTISSLLKSIGYKALAFAVIIGAGVGLYLAIHLPYKVDWTAEGTMIEDLEAVKPILAYTDSLNNDFEGIVCLALSGCDYCHTMIEDLKKMKRRQPDLNMTVFLYAIDSTEIQTIQNQIADLDILVDFAPDPNNSFRVTYGNFPTVLYVKNGSIKQRWFNNQFGYPARDNVESRLF